MGLQVQTAVVRVSQVQSVFGRWLRVVALCGVALLAGCASGPASPQRTAAELPALQLPTGTLTVAAVEQRVATPQLLAVDATMRDFVQLYTGDTDNKRLRLLSLHRAVKGSGTLALEYDPQADGSALEAFHRGSANCLSYANLFIALAREAGLDANYQWLAVRPQWTRMGERVAVRLHVNVLIHLPRGEQFMVDIDPLPTRDIAGSHKITDTDAEALYHNNLAMEALAAGELEQAWLQGVRALQLSPEMAPLWVNIGAIYRHAGQLEAAESTYLYALELDPMERSAMNNLMVLYRLQERDEEHRYWSAEVERYRDHNPYYHAWLGDRAAESEDLRAALGHYKEAVYLSPDDAYLLYAAAVIYSELGEIKAAQRYVERALDAANLQSQRASYQLLLDQLLQQQLAGG